MNPQDPRRGDLFAHSRFIEGSPGVARPAICRVTRVDLNNVWYRVGGGEGPATHRSPRSTFPEKVHPGVAL